jgi:hypothetical protein
MGLARSRWEAHDQVEKVVAMLHRWVVVAAAGVLVLAASCGESNSNAAPFHAVPDDAQPVWGSASCSSQVFPLPIGSRLTCELDLSDPRVSGTETIEQYLAVADGPGGREWTFNRDVITNVKGTWRGSAQGSDDLPGIPVGEAHFVGEGAYQGLEFHYYVTEPALLERALLRGWISGSTGPASSTAPVAPFHAIPSGAVAVSGTAACDATGSGAVDPEGELDGLVACRLDLSDPRVSGTETQDRVRILAGSVGAGDVRVADDARIATTEGTWRGSVQAASDDAAVAAPIGEAHYIGEGAYEGLEFHYYFADLGIAEGGTVLVHGWISPAT